MKSLTGIRLANNRQVVKEFNYLCKRIFELESILGIPHWQPNITSFQVVQERFETLRRQATQQVDLDKDITLSTPITLGEWKARHAK